MQLVASLCAASPRVSSSGAASRCRPRATMRTLLKGSRRRRLSSTRRYACFANRSSQRRREEETEMNAGFRCTTAAANERGGGTGRRYLSNGTDPMPNFGMVICVYNWDVSCENSVCPAACTGCLSRIACDRCIGNQSRFFPRPRRHALAHGYSKPS